MGYKNVMMIISIKITILICCLSMCYEQVDAAPVVFCIHTSVGILSLLLYITQIKSGQITNERESFLDGGVDSEYVE